MIRRELPVLKSDRPYAGGLTRNDCDLILSSLSYTRRAFEAYDYPTPEGRRERLADVDAATAKVRTLRNSLPRKESHA